MTKTESKEEKYIPTLHLTLRHRSPSDRIISRDVGLRLIRFCLKLIQPPHKVKLLF